MSIHLGFSADGLIVLGSRLFAALVAVIIQIALARLLEADQLGRFFLITSIISLLAVFAAGGYPSIINRLMARYKNNGRLLSSFFRYAARESTTAALLIAIGLSAIIHWQIGSTPGALAAGLAMIALTIGRYLGAIANARRRFQAAFLPEVVGRPLLFGGLLLMFWLVDWQLDWGTLLAVFAASVFGSILIQMALLQGFFRPLTPSRPDRRLGRLWRRSAFPLLLAALMSAWFADVIILAASPFLTASDLAVTAICIKSALLVGFAIQLFQQIALPDMADAINRKDLPAARNFALNANRSAFFLALVALFLTISFGSSYLALFGNQYEDGKILLCLLVLAQLIRGWFGPTIHVLALQGASKSNALFSALGIVVLVVVNTILIPTIGIEGVGISVIAAYALSNFFAWKGLNGFPGTVVACHGIGILTAPLSPQQTKGQPSG